MIWLSVLNLVALHGLFAREHARQLAHRWRPDEFGRLVVVDGQLLRPPSRRYARMLRALDTRNDMFGIVHDGGVQSLFVLHPTGAAQHILDAILWHPATSDLDRRLAMRDTRLWHRRHFGFDFVLGSALERADVVLGSDF